MPRKIVTQVTSIIAGVILPLRQSRMILFARNVFVWPLLLLATVSPASAQDASPHLLFSNRSHATVRVEIVSSTSARNVEPVIVLPMRDKRIGLPSGKHLIDLKLSKMVPPRVHRFIADVPKFGGLRYEFSAFRLRRYLFRDVGPKARLNKIASEQTDGHQTNGNHGVQALISFEKVCKAKQLATFRTVLWQDKAHARYFNKRSGHLCSDNGKEMFRVGNVYAHFICANNWLDCQRHKAGDFRILPTIFSSELLDDAALELVRRDEPRTHSVESRKTISPSNPNLTATIAEYLLVYSDRSKP